METHTQRTHAHANRKKERKQVKQKKCRMKELKKKKTGKNTEDSVLLSFFAIFFLLPYMLLVHCLYRLWCRYKGGKRGQKSDCFFLAFLCLFSWRCANSYICPPVGAHHERVYTDCSLSRLECTVRLGTTLEWGGGFQPLRSERGAIL